MPTRRIEIEAISAGDLSSERGIVLVEDPGPLVSLHKEGQDPGDPNTRPLAIMENEDPLRRRIANPGRRGLFAKLARWLRRSLAHQLTVEERATLDEKKHRQALQKVLTAEAKVAQGRMSNRLTGMGICYVRNKTGGGREIRPVRFDTVLMEPNALWFRVNISRLPFGVSVAQLVDQDTVNNLSMAVGHKVSCRWTEEAGLWYIIERASGTMGIPNHVNLTELWERIPASRDSLTIPIGISNNTRPIYHSLDDMVHMMIAGTTGGGKSNFLNVILCTLIRRNRPDRLELLLVDLKGGLEFNYYEGVPHLRSIPKLAPLGIVYERDGVEDLLNYVILEGERRMTVLLRASCKNIGEYNSHRRKNLMTQLVVVIDEWADVKLGNRGRLIEERLANAVQRMRAVGIHVIVCTQVPQREVLGTLIKANMPAKFAFSCADLQGSMAILNNGAALGLQPRGRCIYRFQEQIQVQTPFIPKSLILKTVQGAITGDFGELVREHDVTEDEVKLWALQENNGWLTQTVLFNKYKGRGLTWAELLAWLRRWEGETHLVGSSLYRVEPGSNNRGRRLVVTTDDGSGLGDLE